MKLVEDLNISDEFEIVSVKTTMKVILEKLQNEPGLAILVEDPKQGGICGFIDSQLINGLEAAGEKVQKGNAQGRMLKNILRIIDKTPLARLPQLLPEKQPDAVIVNDVGGAFVGYLSRDDFIEAVELLDGPSSTNSETQAEQSVQDISSSSSESTPPKPRRGPPKSQMKVEIHEVPPPVEDVVETDTITVEEIRDNDIEDESDAFFNRVRGRSVGDIKNIHGELAEAAWGGAAEGTLETGSIMHPLGTGMAGEESEGAEMTQLLMKTSAGEILLKMYDGKAPDTVANFLRLVDKGFYDGLHFHRVIEDFMLQGGCPNSRDPSNPSAGTGDPGWKIPCEQSALAMSHDKPGLMSMANAGPNTGGSQFFLTTVDCRWLDGKHAIFGEVVSGMDVVKAIEGCAKGAGDKPVQPQGIISVSRV